MDLQIICRPFIGMGFYTLVLSLFGLTFAVLGQTTGVDSTFESAPSIPLSSPSSIQQIVQPDGKIIVYGSPLIYGGVAKGSILRLNSDGSLDSSFSYCGCALTTIQNLQLTPDGKLIAAGSDLTNAKMARLNSDGSVDPGFLVTSPGPPPSFGGADFTVNAVQPDGKVLATRRYSSTGFVNFELLRFNADGSSDPGFAPIGIAAGSPMSATVRIQLLSDGRFYLAVTAGVMGQFATLTRRNSNGSVDSTWEAPAFQSNGFPTLVSISDLAFAADGNLLVSGRWDTINGLARKFLVKLLSAGNVDLTFNSPSVLSGNSIDVLSNGKILFSGNTDISTINKIFRLNSDGSPDVTYTMDASVPSVQNSLAVDNSGRAIFLATPMSGTRLVRLNESGSLDTLFNPNLSLFGTVNALARQPDGKILVTGVFTQMNGIPRSGFARVNSDGSLDPSFDPGSGFDNRPETILLQPDGKMLAVGPFTSYNGTPVSGIVRINTNGAIDGGFSATTSSNPVTVALQSDNKILIGGSFSTVNGTPRTGVARLNADGVLDGTFNPTFGSYSIRSIVVQGDGKILVGGSFTGVNGFNRSNLARLMSDGILDQSFTASVTTVGRIWPQQDGKLVLGLSTSASSLTRRNADGSADATFAAPSFSASSSSDTFIHSLLIQPDGSMLVGGRFDTVGTVNRANLTRLAASGALDTLFLPAGANSRVRSIVADFAGKVIIGGDFTSVSNVTKAGIARLNIAPFRVKTPFDYDGDGKGDVSVFRASENKWYILRSSDFGVTQQVFAIAGDIPVPADYDGDGKTDMAIFRPATGDWWSLSSSTGQQIFAHWGMSGDIPRPSDFDGDGRADYVVFRPSALTWYRIGSSNGVSSNKAFGAIGDKPVIGDFDGDGKSDVAVYRPSDGNWWWQSSIDNIQRATRWGISSDIPAPADYDGDGKTDFAVYRPSTGVWYVFNSGNGSFLILPFGVAEDKPVPADYDGDGKADIAVYRPSDGIWYLLQSTAGFTGFRFGISTDLPTQNAFVP